MRQPYVEEAGAFYCTHIQRSDKADIRKFQILDPRGEGFLYIYSLPYENLINHYMRMGFSRLDPENERKLHHRIKPRYDMDCIFMWLPLSE